MIRRGHAWSHIPQGAAPDSFPLRRFFDGSVPLPSAHELKRRYLAGENRDDLALLFKAGRTTIVTALRVMGVKVRDSGLTKRPLMINGKRYPGVLAAMKGEKLGHGAIMKGAVFL